MSRRYSKAFGLNADVFEILVECGWGLLWLTEKLGVSITKTE